MTSVRFTRWRRSRTLWNAGLCAGAAIVLMTGPAAAAPAAPGTPVSPTPSSSSNAPTKPATPAPGSITWAVQPSSAAGPDGRSSFTYNNLKPGTVVHDYVGVTNYSKMPVTFQVYASDAFETSTGSLDLLAADTKSTDIGSWVTVLNPTITVPPSARVNEPITLTIPGNASPGDHVGGILASVSVASTNAGGSKVNVDRRLAVPLFLRVSGPLLPAMGIESLSMGGYHGTVNPLGGGGSTVSYTVHNTGNVRLDASQIVTVTGPFGVTLATVHPASVTDLLPGATLRMAAHLSGVFPAGPLTVHVHLTPAEAGGLRTADVTPAAVSRTASMWASPWPQLLVLILVVALGFGVRWWLRWRRRRTENVVAAAVAQARRETVEELARANSQPVGAGAGGRSPSPGNP